MFLADAKDYLLKTNRISEQQILVEKVPVRASSVRTHAYNTQNEDKCCIILRITHRENYVQVDGRPAIHQML